METQEKNDSVVVNMANDGTKMEPTPVPNPISNDSDPTPIKETKSKSKNSLAKSKPKLSEEPIELNDISKMSPQQKWAYNFFILRTTKLSKVFEGISVLFIVVSTVIVLIETLPSFADEKGVSKLLTTLLPVEIIISIFWITELIGRFFASTHKLYFFTRFLNIVDFLSITPLFLGLVNDRLVNDFSRMIRLIRVWKLFHVVRYSPGLVVAAKAFRRSVNAIGLLFGFIIVLMLISSGAMYWAERGTYNPDKNEWARNASIINGTADFTYATTSPFGSVPQGFYWTITTLTTVGYGDVYPITPVGKLIACLTMICAIFVIALPTSVIGSNFMTEWQLYNQSVLQKKVKDKVEKSAAALKVADFISLKELDNNIKEQNEKYFKTVATLQDLVNEINPPQYYDQYKKLLEQYNAAKEKYTDLQIKLQRAREMAGKNSLVGTLKKASIVATLRKRSSTVDSPAAVESPGPIRNPVLKEQEILKEEEM